MRATGWRLGPVLALAVGFLACVPAPVRREPVEGRPDLERAVLPLLKARCVKCHGPIKPTGKLNLRNPRSMARGGSNGPVVEAGNPDESTLRELVSGDGYPGTYAVHK
jgi:hypothetical protein